MGETRSCVVWATSDYLLVEHGRDGRITAEDFPAPDDASALERAREVAEAAGELWCSGRLVARWNGAHA